jgi:hypothetical protein
LSWGGNAPALHGRELRAAQPAWSLPTCHARAARHGALLKAGLSYGFFLAKHPDRVAQALAYSNAAQAARKARVGRWPHWLGEQHL